MLYLRNTNQMQSLDRGIQRGGAESLISSSVSASYTTNSSSLFVLLNDAVTILSTTASATTNFLAAPNSVVSASLSATTPSSSVTMSLFISASNGSLLFTGSSTGSGIMTSFVVGSDVRYTISSSFNRPAAFELANGLFRTQYTGSFTSPAWFATAVQSGSMGPNTGSINPGFANPVDYVSVQWLGYFTPTTTENYTFFAFSDDAMYMWIGNDAITNFTTGSKNIGTGSAGPNYLTGSVISLTSGSSYPMRIQWGEQEGGAYLSMSYQTPTIAKTTNWTPNMSYNTATNGF
jgi:hypothetical protein